MSQKAFVIGVGIYPSISMLNHCCTPNVVYQKKGNRFVCTALKDIDKGFRNLVLKNIDTEVNASYLNVDWPTQERQERISANWLFDCQCTACTDPTDLETEVKKIFSI